MEIRRERIATTVGHREQGPTPVDAYNLDTGRGLAITIWTYGAALVEVLVPDRQGRVDNVVLRLPDLESYQNREQNPYMGTTVGRYARCIAGARFTLAGVEHRLDCNYPPHHLHGGTFGFDRFVWKAEGEARRHEVSLHMHLDRPDGDQGYPGAISATTAFRLDREGCLTFEHTARTTRSTVVDITNHAYWNLAGVGNINDHYLTLNAYRLLQVDHDLIPVGPPRLAVGSFDYSNRRLLSCNRLDHCFVLEDPSWAAELFEPGSGRKLRLVTDQPGLQIYSGDLLPRRRAGLTLQSGSWPNSPNRPDYPSTRLDPGVVYRHRTRHFFSTAEA